MRASWAVEYSEPDDHAAVVSFFDDDCGAVPSGATDEVGATMPAMAIAFLADPNADIDVSLAPMLTCRATMQPRSTSKDKATSPRTESPVAPTPAAASTNRRIPRAPVVTEAWRR
jgi:hypothetical protein